MQTWKQMNHSVQEAFILLITTTTSNKLPKFKQQYFHAVHISMQYKLMMWQQRTKYNFN